MNFFKRRYKTTILSILQAERPSRNIGDMSRRYRPVKMKTRRLWPVIWALLFLGGLIGAAGWAWQRVHDPRVLPFHDVKIQGKFHRLDALQLQKQVQQHINGGFFALDMLALKQNLMHLPWVEDVAVRRVPGVLIVSIREQKPVAQWNDHDLFNSEGELFTAPPDAPRDLPALRGPEGSQQMMLSYYQQINTMLKPLNLQIMMLHLTQQGSWDVTLNNGISVMMGREEALSRMRRWIRWYPRIAAEQSEKIVHADLRYQNGIAVERANPYNGGFIER